MKNSNGTLVLAALAVLATQLRGADWQSYQHDSQHTGRSTASFDPAQLTFSWSAPTGYATPIIVGSSVIATRKQSGTPTVSSFDLFTGAVNWSYTAMAMLSYSQAAYGNGLVAFSGQDFATSAKRLYVINAATGALNYTVPLSDANLALPVIATVSGGNTVAYLATASALTAVQLGATSGSVLWTASGSFGGSSIPSIIGNSLLLAGPGQYYSIDAATGTANHFHAGGLSGGGGTTVAVDSARNQFYVLEDFSSSIPVALTAYQYVNNSTIVQKWQKTGPGIESGSSVAIGANGNVYASAGETLLEIDPVTGLTLRSKSGQSFANAVTPIVTANALVAFSQAQTLFYSLNDLSLVNALPGSRGSSNSPFDSPGAVDDTHFVLDYGRVGSRPGFDVYTAPAPEPSATLLLGLGAAAAVCRRRRGGK
jgi:hypothetical protein